MKTIILNSLLLFCLPCFAQTDPPTWDNINKDSSLIFKDGLIVKLLTINTKLQIEEREFIVTSDKLIFENVNKDLINVLHSGNEKIAVRWRNNKFSILCGNKELKIERKQSNIPPIDSVQNKLSAKINIFYDALSLKENLDVNDIFKKYNVDSKNIYLNRISSDGIRGTTSASKLLNTIGNTEVTAIADGLAQFLVSRVKKELSIAFFQDFKKTIQDNKFKDFQILFKDSYEHLNLIDDKIYDFKPYLSSIRTNAITDFKVLPYRLSAVLADTSTKLNKFTEGKPNLKYSLGLSFNLINELNDNKNFGIAIEKLDTKQYEPKEGNVKDLKTAIELFRLVSFALKDSSVTDSSYYLSPNNITRLKNDTTLLQYFIGLMVATTKLKVGNISFDPTLYDSLNRDSTKVKLMKSSQFLDGFKDAASLFKQSKGQAGSEKISLYFSGISKFIESGKTFNSLLNDKKADSIFVWLEKSNTLVKNLYAKNYTTSMLQILDFYTSFAVKGDKKFNQKLYKYGTFLAQISQLDDAKEVQQLIEVYAAPVGSYRDKSANSFSVAFDSYVGAGFGFFNEIKGDTSSFVISTPIGISMSLGFPSNKWFSSITIMPTLFDIGPLVSYRFKNSEEKIAKIYLKEIISPGIFGSIGLHKDYPLFLNVGWQKPATLTGIGTDTNTYNLKPYNYFSASLAVNIPLLSLYNR